MDCIHRGNSLFRAGPSELFTGDRNATAAILLAETAFLDRSSMDWDRTVLALGADRGLGRAARLSRRIRLAGESEALDGQRT